LALFSVFKTTFKRAFIKAIKNVIIYYILNFLILYRRDANSNVAARWPIDIDNIKDGTIVIECDIELVMGHDECYVKAGRQRYNSIERFFTLTVELDLNT